MINLINYLLEIKFLSQRILLLNVTVYLQDLGQLKVEILLPLLDLNSQLLKKITLFTLMESSVKLRMVQHKMK